MAKAKLETEAKANPLPVADPAREPVPRVSIPLNKDGRIDWDRMRPSTRDQLATLLRDPLLASKESAAAPDIFNAAWCSMIFDALGQLEIALVMRIYRCTHEQALVMLYTDADKAILTAPTAKVLNKYAGSMFLKYGDEVALAMLLGSMGLTKVSALRATLASSQLPLPGIERRPMGRETFARSRAPSIPRESSAAAQGITHTLDPDAKVPGAAPDGPRIETASDR